MNKLTTGKRLKQLMADRGLRQVDILEKAAPFFTDKTKISKTDLSQYINDKTEPRQDKLFILAKALNVNEAWLMGFDTNSEPQNNPSEIADNDVSVTVPQSHELLTTIFNDLNDSYKNKVISFAKEQLNKQNSVQETVIPFSPRTKQKGSEITIYGAVSAGTGEMLGDGVTTQRVYYGKIPHHDYALTVNGDSMQPLFADGQIIFVKNVQDDMEFLDGQIVIAILNGESFIKKLRIMENCAQLISLNSKYDPIEVSADDDFKIKGKVIL